MCAVRVDQYGAVAERGARSTICANRVTAAVLTRQGEVAGRCRLTFVVVFFQGDLGAIGELELQIVA